MATTSEPPLADAGRAVVWPLGDDPVADLGGQVSSPAVVGVGDLRATNAAAVLAAVRSADRPPRLATLAQSTKLSRPTVEVLVDDLVGCGLIEEVPAAPGQGLRSPGRPARRFRFQPRAGFVVGVDVRAHSISACLADLDGTFLTVKRRTVRADLTGRTRAGAVTATIRAAMEQAGVGAGQICAATVGTPGLVERGNARIRYVDHMKTWAEVDIVTVMAEALGCPVAVENDANLAALGEHWRGAGTATSEMLFILLGRRLGAGIITGGRLLRGHHGAAGEIGFPGRSTAEGPGLGSLAGDHPGAAAPGRTHRPTTSAAVIAAAAAGDADAVAVLESVGQRLAEGIAPVLLALDPAVVVLGTSLFPEPGLVPAADLLRRAAERRAAGLLVEPPEWRLSALGDQAILTGAVRFALSAVERVLLTRPTSLFGA
ncbi:ROK family protein [Nonomuraea basaltis]|uniref:ROK family protein n=1 Tax=Nonomuraea basaltis TaxID=2495887 RepID=UPI00110C538F|nr:ROK family protein [Nonomuraea basaltis]TMR94946.1 ROK family protein [Nonomuraea basaltis]